MNEKDKQINGLKKQIYELKKLVRGLTLENEYLKSPLYLFEITEAIQGRYSSLLNPPSQEFKTTSLKQKSCTFLINVTDIVCIQSDRKMKWIYFTKKQVSISGERFESDKLHFTGTIEDFCKKYDTTGIHLCMVSRSIAVNPSYYFLNSKKLQLLGNIIPHDTCNHLPISPKFINDFIERKTTLEKISSFQKIGFRSK